MCTHFAVSALQRKQLQMQMIRVEKWELLFSSWEIDSRQFLCHTRLQSLMKILWSLGDLYLTSYLMYSSVLPNVLHLEPIFLYNVIPIWLLCKFQNVCWCWSSGRQWKDYLPTIWLFSSLRTLAFLIADAHSSLSTACCLHFLTCISVGPFQHLSIISIYVLPLFFSPVYSQCFNYPCTIQSYEMSYPYKSFLFNVMFHGRKEAEHKRSVGVTCLVHSFTCLF